jgi:S-methylmethionine-dependent homocysteine/selenocysteine methylase
MDSLDSVMDAIESRKTKSLLAVGINCSAPRHVEAALKTMAKRTQVRFALFCSQKHVFPVSNCNI